MKRKISKINRETSALGMGCWAIGGEWTFGGGTAGWGKTDNGESIKAIEAAYDTGIRLFDTAATYGAGLSEELVGKALKGKRSECTISSKIGYNLIPGTRNCELYSSPKEFIKQIDSDVDSSLKRLNTDYLDVLFLHIGELEKEFAPEVKEKFEKLVEVGKIRSYGWSTDDPERAKLWDRGKHYSSIQINYNVTVEAEELKELGERADLSIFNRGPLAMGWLTGKYTRDTKFPKGDLREAQWVDNMMKNPVLDKLDDIRDILTSNGRTLSQGALAWIWASNSRMLPIPGIRNVKQAIENGRAMEFGPLSQDEYRAIEKIMGRR